MPDWSRQCSKNSIMSGVIRRRTVRAEFSRCFFLTKGAFKSSFIVASAASWQMLATSAPEHPSVCRVS